MKLDATGRVIEIGDHVAAIFVRWSGAPPELNIFKIIGFTLKQVRIENDSGVINKYNHLLVRLDYKPEDLAVMIKES